MGLEPQLNKKEQAVGFSQESLTSLEWNTNRANVVQRSFIQQLETQGLA